jgi:hypothetical protein
MPTIVVATAAGTHVLGIDGGPARIELAGRSVTWLARDRDRLWAIVDGAELWHRDEDWRQVAHAPGWRATCAAVMAGEVLVGTAEAHLLRLVDDELRIVEPFEAVDGRGGWYTPWGGPPDTRSIANWDEDIYVNVHVGGIPRTSDGGRSWTPTIDVDADVHQVTTATGAVLAACAGGLAVSTDRGGSWTMRNEGLSAPYSRAVAVCGAAVLVSSSEGPRGGRAAVYRGAIASGGFEHCAAGPGWFDGNIDTACLDALPDGALAAFGTADGRLYASTDGGSTWHEVATSLPEVRRVLVMP